MWLRVVCPNGHALKIGEEHAGKRGVCPRCKAPVEIPTADQAGELATSSAPATTSSAPSSSPRTTPGSSTHTVRPTSARPSLAEPRTVGVRTAPVSRHVPETSSDPDSSEISDDPDSPLHTAYRSCRSCHRQVPARYTVCPHCRAYLTDSAVANTRTTSICPSCQTASFPGAELCMNCGTRLLTR